MIHYTGYRAARLSPGGYLIGYMTSRPHEEIAASCNGIHQLGYSLGSHSLSGEAVWQEKIADGHMDFLSPAVGGHATRGPDHERASFDT